VIDSERVWILEFRAARVSEQRETPDQRGPERCGDPHAVTFQPQPLAGDADPGPQGGERPRGRDRQNDAWNRTMSGHTVSPRGVQTDERNR
jgi:hypothetical protein